MCCGTTSLEGVGCVGCVGGEWGWWWWWWGGGGGGVGGGGWWRGANSCHDFISRVLKKNAHLWSLGYGWFKQENNLRLLTGMPWLATFRPPPSCMLFRVPPRTTYGRVCFWQWTRKIYIDCLVQEFSNTIANALQLCTKSSTWSSKCNSGSIGKISNWSSYLTHLPLVPYIYASENWVSIGSDNGLSPIRRQAII